MLNFEKISQRCGIAYNSFVNRGFKNDEAIRLVEKMLPDIMYDIEKDEWDKEIVGRGCEVRRL